MTFCLFISVLPHIFLSFSPLFGVESKALNIFEIIENIPKSLWFFVQPLVASSFARNSQLEGLLS